MSLTFQNALRAYKDGAQIDFRQNSCCPWEENPFLKRDKLIDGGQDSVLMVESALERDAEFRIRPEKRSRISVFLDGTPFCPDGPAEKLAQKSVRAALKDVREHLASKVPAAGRDFLDKIENDFCGNPPAPYAVKVGQQWRHREPGNEHDGTVLTVGKVDPSFVYFTDDPGDPVAWMLERFLLLGKPTTMKCWFEFVGGPL